jgi:hypothetical protein
VGWGAPTLAILSRPRARLHGRRQWVCLFTNVDVSSEQIPDSGNAGERSEELNQFEIKEFREAK